MLQEFTNDAETFGCDAVILMAGIFEKQEEGFDLVQWYKKHGFQQMGKVGELPLMVKWFSTERATASMKKFKSSLLHKAFVDMHESPTMLPPRDDMKRHLDEQEQQNITDDVKGIKPKPQTNMIDPRINPDGVIAGKQAYDEDSQAEYFLEQIQDAKNEAKRVFMDDEYMQQLCNDYTPPKTMEELWEIMKDEYTAEYFGTPYSRVPDFTDQKTGSQTCPLCQSAKVKTIEDKGYKSNVVLAECQNCAGFFAV